MARANSTFQGGGFIEKTLRFFNLLEPGGMVLSLSKLMVWVMLGVVVVVTFTAPQYLYVVLPAMMTAVGNYGYRRYMQYKHGQPPYPMPEISGGTEVSVTVRDKKSGDDALDNLDLGGPHA